MLMENKKRITIIVLVILCIGLVVSLWSASTYALFSSDVYGSNYETFNTGLLSITAKSKSDNISLTDALPMSDDDGKLITPYVFTITNVGNLDYNFNIKLLSTSSNSFNSSYIKLQVDDGDVVTLSSLSDSIIKNDITLLAGESIDVSIRIWLDEDTPNSELGKVFESKIVTDGQAVYTSSNNGVTLVNHIKYLYDNNVDEENPVSNGPEDALIYYNYANIYDTDDDDTTSGGLMNDRLGGTTANYNAGNIRYYGANPNNYVDIGDVYEQDTVVNHYEENAWFLNPLGITSQEICLAAVNCATNYSSFGFSDESSCKVMLTSMLGTYEASGICGTETIHAGTTKSLYRIIGLFKDVELENGTKEDLVKVIRNDVIGRYSWDQSESTVNSGYGVNEWSQADLMKLLNPGYESETVGGSLYWNSDSGICYGKDRVNKVYTSIPCDFTNKGISTNAQNNIEVVKWHLGGWGTGTLDSVFANQMYKYERLGNVIQNPSDGITRTTVWPGRIALAYQSDYGYAVDLKNCSFNFKYYENCISTNWMYSRMTFVGNLGSWFLNPNSDEASTVYVVTSGGIISSVGMTFSDFAVAPVFYLDSELVIESGNGTQTDPYIIK